MNSAQKVSDATAPVGGVPREGGPGARSPDPMDPAAVPSGTWVVDPAGRAGAGIAGTLADPWSFAYAASGADGRIRPGHTVWLRAGIYRSELGVTISFSGAADRPVTWMVAPDERFELDGAIPEFVDTPGIAWEPVEVRDGHNLYRSTSVYPSSFMYGGFIEIDGQWLPLATHDHKNGRDWIGSDHHNWRHSEPYYLGPGICHVPDDTNPARGRLYVRLDSSTPEAQCHRSVAQIVDPDPRHHALRISRGDRFGLTVQGSHHIFEGFTDINNYYGGLRLPSTVSHLTFRRVGGRVTYFGARLGRASDLLIEDPSFDGCMDPETWWISWIDVMGAGLPADHVRKCGLDYGLAHHVEVAGGYFHDFFDSALSEGAHDITVHNVEFRTWGDAWQMYGSLYHIDLHHNTYLGAGPSRDGTGTGLANPAPGTLWIHDNIIDSSRYRIFYYRFGHPKDPTGIGWREPIPFSEHRVPTTDRRTIPWKLYQNTIVTGINGIPHVSYVGLGQFGNSTAIVEAPHEVYNNIILVRDGPPLGRDAWADTAAEIYDGNVYWGWSNPSLSSYTSIWRFLHRSAGLVDGENPKGSIGDVNKLRGLALQDSRMYYPPGWESAGLSADPKLDADYKPLNPDIATGAINLTATRWPGTSVYKPWRGAVQPWAARPVDRWLAPVDLSADGQDASGPQVAVDAQGNVVAVWYRFNGTNWTVQAA
ncbi:MAG: hypothetical protein ACRDTH_18265, partial [Pseudonocardiaceae bacterium]